MIINPQSYTLCITQRFTIVSALEAKAMVLRSRVAYLKAQTSERAADQLDTAETELAKTLDLINLFQQDC